ncbi:Killer cell lectin-like receptor subfamily G [Mactra antiquata]
MAIYTYNVLVGFVLCGLYHNTVQLPLKSHPPVWEYTYQYELFEKNYKATLSLQSLISRLRNKLELTKCPTHWMTGGDYCYRLSQYQKLDWYKSQEACERVDGHLAVIDSEEEGDLVTVLLTKYTKKENIKQNKVWIGGYWSEEYWRWVTGSRLDNETITLEDINFDMSSKSESHKELCLSWKEGVQNTTCDTNLHYLCERKPQPLI